MKKAFFPGSRGTPSNLRQRKEDAEATVSNVESQRQKGTKMLLRPRLSKIGVSGYGRLLQMLLPIHLRQFTLNNHPTISQPPSLFAGHHSTPSKAVAYAYGGGTYGSAASTIPSIQPFANQPSAFSAHPQCLAPSLGPYHS